MGNPWWLVLALLLVAVAAYVQASTGFGFALLSAPGLLLGLEAHAAVTALLLLHSLQCVLVLARTWRTVSLQSILPLVVGGLIGTPLGAAIATRLPPMQLQLGIGVMILVSGISMLVTSPRPITAEKLGSAAAGFVSGLLNGSTGLSGPPIAFFLGNQGWDGERLRSALIATFLVINLAALAMLAALGTLATSEIGLPIALLAPAVVVGVAAASHAGNRMARLDGPAIRLATGGFIVAAGIASLARVIAIGARLP